jgi:hypothetical protein
MPRRFGLCWLALLIARVASAQAIGGTVRDSLSGQPLSGVVVMLLPQPDSATARALTDQSGRFRFRGVSDSSGTLRLMRIGYRPRIVTFGGSDSLEIALVRLSDLLDTVRTVAGRSCPTRPDAARAAALWQQAQAALAAAAVWRDHSPANMRVIRYHRTLPRTGPRVTKRLFEYIPEIVDQNIRIVDGVSTRAFGTNRSAEAFADSGFADSGRLYTPDEDVLLADAFARTHCFRIANSQRDSPLVGVKFEPVASRGALTDIRGTLWLDSSRSVLDSVEFTFVDLPPAMNATDSSVGGSLTFTTMANGVPLLTAVRLVTPAPGLAEFQGSPAPSAIRAYATTLQYEDGGRLVSAQWPDGMTWSAPTAVQRGVVIDPASGQPRAGVPIELVNAGLTTRSDSAGRFQFRDLIEGPYELAVDDTLTVVFHDLVHAAEARVRGFRSGKQRFEGNRPLPADVPLVQRILVASDSNPLIRVDLPRLDAAFRARCRIASQDDSTAVLAVWAVNATTAKAHARITATWSGSVRGEHRTVRTDDRGRAIICGVPRGRVLVVTEALDGTANAPSRVVGSVSIDAKRSVAYLLLNR